MSISHILNQVRRKHVSYNKSGDFTVPLQWKRVPNMTFALISKEHAQMIAAASGRKLTPHSMYLPNRDDFLGIGENSATLLRLADGNYALRHERRDFDNPITLPKSLDLSRHLKSPEEPQDRPTEMTPEDYYM